MAKKQSDNATSAGRIRVKQVRSVIGYDKKRLHLCHSLHRNAFDQPLAVSEQLLLNVDLAGPKSTPFSARSHTLLEGLLEDQRDLSPPAFLGRIIALPGAR